MNAEQTWPMLVADVSLNVSFEPGPIRDHFEGDDPDPTEGLTDEQLKAIGYYAIGSDQLWALFHELLVEALDAYENGEINA